jgi:hypothetical protein
VTTILEKLAVRLLAISGRQAIFDLYDAASTAYGSGKPDVAGSLIEIAESADRVTRGARTVDVDALAGVGTVHTALVSVS